MDVALPVPVDKAFTYEVPDELAGAVLPGCRVLVPFGRRRMTGYVTGVRKRRPSRVRLRTVTALVDEEPVLDEDILWLARWMAEYYVHPLGEVLKAVLPAGLKGKGRVGGEDETAGTFPEEVDSPVLNEEQRTAFDTVCDVLGRRREREVLLHGVTGSGKTEVYLRCIGEALRLGRSALVLIPEIALIPQTTSRFRNRFGRDVAVLHSRLTGAQRFSIWRGAARGDIRVVIGARSAAFVPLTDLGIIVIDEEQDGSFKQEEKPHYSAVTVARRRAERAGAVLLLGSATPSLETFEMARAGRIASFALRSRPVGGAHPAIEIVDMREREGLVSEELLDALELCVSRKEQAIVLLNRRGHANFVQCRTCGWIDRCPNCSISLTYHSRGHRLVCHYCNHRAEPPDICPSCGAYKIRHFGVGTQRIEMELGNLLPGIRVARMDLDTTRGKRGHLAILERFSRREVDIIIGTQMVAKGHHYPNVTVVGVLAADAGLNFPDFRSAERTFQLLFQASGRTGRGEKGGRVIVQTLAPEHYLYGYLVNHDYTGFAKAELSLRRELRYPPADRLALLTVSSRSKEKAIEGAERVYVAARDLLEKRKYDILGPTPALIERLRGRYRMLVLVKGEMTRAVKRNVVDTARRAVARLGRTDLRWDFDPYDMS
ncbi:MAG: primosomal protein N' [bacterium]|nr:MAG: primosomal protein N' [bacterium]